LTGGPCLGSQRGLCCALYFASFLRSDIVTKS